MNKGHELFVNLLIFGECGVKIDTDTLDARVMTEEEIQRLMDEYKI